MKLLVFTTLYPNAAAPSHGVFVENRLRAFLARHDADVRVVAPVPWFPFRAKAFGAYGAYARAPLDDTRHGIAIWHPRYLIPPKLAMQFAPRALEHCLAQMLRRFQAEGWAPDLIDAHYLYPDAVAAARVAKRVDLPVAVTARGTDVNLLPSYSGPRRDILNTVRGADAVITVANALKDELVRLGAPAEKIRPLRNGVDLETFAPMDRAAARRTLGLDPGGKIIASVGHLIARKGHDLVIEAAAIMEDTTLLIAGDGPQRRTLEARAKKSGARVQFLGRVAHENLRAVYSAADALVLASSREGWPNVLLEAMACGTPCVASDVWGAREVIRAPEAGRLVKERKPNAFADELRALLAAPPDRAATRRYAEAHSWTATADAMAEIFDELAAKSARRRAEAPRVLKIKEPRPRLIVTVDTEEAFDWAAPGGEWTAPAPEGIARFQSLCEDRGAAPLYFLTAPLIEDAANAAFFRDRFAAGAADGGLHLHQWASPPASNYAGAYYSFQMNLPRDQHGEKLRRLAALFETAFGARAIAHRAGRYGFAPGDYDLLAAAGVRLDFSPSAGFDFSREGGPDFTAAANAPHQFTTPQGPVFVTPVCGARAINRTRAFLSQPAAACLQSVTTPMRLSPEGASLADMKALARRLAADNIPVLTFTLHSTSLTKGAGPYAQSRAEVDDMLNKTVAFLDWFRTSLGGETISLRDLAALYDRADALRA